MNITYLKNLVGDCDHKNNTFWLSFVGLTLFLQYRNWLSYKNALENNNYQDRNKIRNKYLINALISLLVSYLIVWVIDWVFNSVSRRSYSFGHRHNTEDYIRSYLRKTEVKDDVLSTISELMRSPRATVYTISDVGSFLS